MFFKTAMGIAAGAGLCFLGYCVYFDRKRRSDPDFKKKLRERRQKTKLLGKQQGGSSQFPDPNDRSAMQKFFIEEVKLSEDLLEKNEFESGVEHLANAVAVCSEPQQLVQALQQTLPPHVFDWVLKELPSAQMRFLASAAAARPKSEPKLQEEDLE